MQRPLSEVVSAVARELKQLATQTTDLQDQMSMASYTEIDVVGLQSLDSITQTLACLSTFLDELAAQTRCGCGIALKPALDRICLADLAKRLEAGDDITLPQPSDCELF